MQLRPVFGKSILLGASVCSLVSGCALSGPAGSHLLTSSGHANGCPMDGNALNGSSVSSSSADGWGTGGPAGSGPADSGPAYSGPADSQWEDPCSPEWPAACMPGALSPAPTPLLDGLARLPHRQGLPEAPPYPRFHPLPTRPMFSSTPAAAPPPEIAPPLAGSDEPLFQ